MIGSNIVPVDITQSTNELIKIWSVINNETQTVRVVVIHKDLNATQAASVTINISNASNSAPARLTRLMAPSPYSFFNVTLAGQTFDGSLDGSPVGAYFYETITGSNGAYSFSVPPLTVAFLEV